MRIEFAKIVYEQSKYGENETIKAIEKELGNFPFDDERVNDGVPKVVVGPQELENKAVYYGHWNPVTNERHGFGLQIWPDGSKYVGYWKSDRANGLGRLMHCDGNVYSGEWKDDMAHGQGEYKDASGMHYKGEWVNDQQEGRGNHI